MALATRRRPTTNIRRILADALADRLTWNADLQRYRSVATGRLLGKLDVRLEIDREIDASERRLQAVGRRFLGREIDVNDWRALSADEIKLNFLANYAAAKGGYGRLTDQDYRQVENMVRRQFRYLERFARQVDANPERFTTKGFLNRIGMYAQAGREAYEGARRDSHKAAGFLYERNITHSSESCSAHKGKPGCTELTKLRWVAIGSLPLPGRRACYTRCKCTFDFAKTLPAGTVIQVVGKKGAAGKTLRTKTATRKRGDGIKETPDQKLERERAERLARIQKRNRERDAELKKEREEEAERVARRQARIDQRNREAEERRQAQLRKEREEAERRRSLAPAARRKLEDIQLEQAAKVADLEQRALDLTIQLETNFDRLHGEEALRLPGPVYDRIQEEVNELFAKRNALYKDISDAKNDIRKRALVEVVWADEDKRPTLRTTNTAKLKYAPQRRQNIKDGVEQFQALVGIDVPDELITFDKQDPKKRSAYYQYQREIRCELTISVRTVVHELGHWLEYNAPGVQAKAFDFYNQRTQGEALQKLRDVTGIKAYGKDEVTKVDKFRDAYMGKWYEWNGNQRATEIVSMGIEALYADPFQFAEDDPEYFDFIYNVLRGI